MSKIVMSVNAGSSTLKYQLFALEDERVLAQGLIDRIGNPAVTFSIRIGEESFKEQPDSVSSYQDAVEYLLQALTRFGVVSSLEQIVGVGHRVAHGGETFTCAAMVDELVLGQIQSLCELAPLHNPANLAGIQTIMSKLPNSLNVAVFDTAFHQTMEPEHYLYPIPYKFYQDFGVRRYGFHGTSHQYVAQRCADLMDRPLSETRIITCHLGNGASVCAVKGGRSVNTSMGFTPLAGLMMGTRCGDIDPSILPFLQERQGLDADDLNQMMNRESGFLGVSGVSNDCREVEIAAKEGNEQAALALRLFAERIRAFIGSYLVQMGGADALVFTGGIGENSVLVRHLVCEGLKELGIELDEAKNKAGSETIHVKGSKMVIGVINTNEELMMAREVMSQLNTQDFEK